MVRCNIHNTKFAILINRPFSLLHIFNQISSLTPCTNNAITTPQLRRLLPSECKFPQEFLIPSISPIKAPADVSRRGTSHNGSLGLFSFAYQLLDEMPQRRRRSDYALLRDVFKIVQSASEEPNVVGSKIVHALALKQGAVADLRIATSLLTLYSRSGDLGSSMALFSEVLDKDAVFWNAMMSACIENKYFEGALVFFVKMIGDGDELDATTLVILVSAFSHLRSLGQGKVVHGLSIKAGMLSDTVLSNAVIDMYTKCGDLSSSEHVFAGLECRDLVTWNSMISGCFYNGCPEKSLQYFAHMASCENEVDEVTISSAMAACTCSQDFDFGLEIHGLGIKLGFAETNHISVANSLISFYSQFRDVFTAECVFKGMMVKNVVSWNAMIKGLLFNGEAAEAFHILHCMQFVASIQPDMATVVTAIPFCAELMLLREGKVIHGFAVRREMVSELLVTNSLINMYSKCNKVKDAEHLFLAMPKKDLVAWNTMISGYAQNGQPTEAQTLFQKMQVSCSACTLPTLLAIIQSCDSPYSLQFGKSIHGWHIKLGFLNQLYAVNSLMHMYISCGDLSDAFTLFSSFLNKADVSSWNTVISGCTQKGRFQEALTYFDLMRKISRFHFNSVTLVGIISACGNLGLAWEGKLIHGLALKSRVGTDIQVQNSIVTMYGRLGDTRSARLVFDSSADHNMCSWNCIISAHSQNEDARKALELFRSIDFQPNEMTISTILSACTQLGSMNYGKQIHGHVFRFGFQKNSFVCAALMDMYSNCGRLDLAEEIFLSSSDKSTAVWNSLISAYGFHSFGSKAVETFKDMVKSGIRPTNTTFTGLLSACSHSGLVDEGHMYYDNMFSKFRVHPTVEHHVCMVDMLGRSGGLDEAYDFIKNLKTPPAAGIWGALLSACSYHGDLEMGREVAQILFRLDPGNVSYLVTLCNMYVAAGRWEEAVELRSMIQDKQLKKPVGFSLIDVGVR